MANRCTTAQSTEVVRRWAPPAMVTLAATAAQDMLDRIAPTALPRSSLIISDESLHRETNYRTEFVIALNDQPQGGIINRPRSPDIRVGFGWGGWGFNNTPGRSGYYQRPHSWW